MGRLVKRRAGAPCRAGRSSDCHKIAPEHGQALSFARGRNILMQQSRQYCRNYHGFIGGKSARFRRQPGAHASLHRSNDLR
jgi:hypothetical protein